MKRNLLIIVALYIAASAMGQEAVNKLAFTVQGPERSYNQVRVVNHSSYSDFQCRVVFLNDDNSVDMQYGTYHLKGYDDTDTNSIDVRRGTRLGVQMAQDFEGEVTFSVEYKDYPFYDVIMIYINDLSGGFTDEF